MLSARDIGKIRNIIFFVISTLYYQKKIKDIVNLQNQRLPVEVTAKTKQQMCIALYLGNALPNSQNT